MPRTVFTTLRRLLAALALVAFGLFPAAAEEPSERVLNLQLGSLFHDLPRLVKWDGEIRYAALGIQKGELELFDRYMELMGKAAGIRVRNARVPQRLQENAIVIFLENYLDKVEDKVLQKIFMLPNEDLPRMKARFTGYDKNRLPGFCRMVDDQGSIQRMYCLAIPRYHKPEAAREDVIWRAVSDIFSIRRAEYLRPSIFNTQPVGLPGDRLGRVDEAIIRSIYDYSIPPGQNLDLALKRVSELLQERLKGR